MKIKLATLVFCMSAATAAQADDVSYDFSGGTLGSTTTTGVFADGTYSPAFYPVPGFTLNTATLAGSVSNGIGTYTESFAFNTADIGVFFTEPEGSARFTVNYMGAKPVVTSFAASTPEGYPSGDLHGFAWSWSYLKTATSSVLTEVEEFTAYGSNASGFATQTLNNVGISTAGVPAPEMDPSSSASAITLLLGGLLVLRSRKHRGSR